MTSASKTGLKTDDFSHKCSNFGLADNKFDFQTSKKYVLDTLISEINAMP